MPKKKKKSNGLRSSPGFVAFLLFSPLSRCVLYIKGKEKQDMSSFLILNEVTEWSSTNQRELKKPKNQDRQKSEIPDCFNHSIFSPGGRTKEKISRWKNSNQKKHKLKKMGSQPTRRESWITAKELFMLYYALLLM